jgi:hypothetical protein
MLGHMRSLRAYCDARSLQDEIRGEREVPPHPEVQCTREAFIAVVGAFDAALVDDPEHGKRGLQGKLGLVVAKVRRDFILASPAPPRLREVASSSLVPHASEWLLAFAVSRAEQAMLVLDFVWCLRYMSRLNTGYSGQGGRHACRAGRETCMLNTGICRMSAGL